MLRRTLCTTVLVAVVGAFAAVSDADAQPALRDHQVMVSEHTSLRGIGSWFGQAFQPVRILDTEVPSTLEVGEEGLFSIQANVEHASLPISSAWDFDDGTSAAGLSVRHAFERPGTYEVRVRVSNHGSEVTRSFEVVVKKPGRAG